jgi:hypothetical protein
MRISSDFVEEFDLHGNMHYMHVIARNPKGPVVTCGAIYAWAT